MEMEEEKEVDRACGIGIICRMMSTSRDAIVRLDHGRLGAASFGFSFGCEGGSSNAGPNAAGRESERRFRRTSAADVELAWRKEERARVYGYNQE